MVEVFGGLTKEDIETSKIVYTVKNGVTMTIRVKGGDKETILSTRVGNPDESFIDLCKYIKRNNLSVVEMGVGLGQSLDYFIEYNINYTCIELNKELFNLHKDKYNLIQGDFWEYINNNDFENTIFIYRAKGFFIKNLLEYIKFKLLFTKHFNKGNYLAFPNTQKIKSINYDKIFKHASTYMYITKLD